MLKISLFAILLLSCAISVSAQTEADFEAIYNKRIQEEMINGVYIPADLNEAHSELERLSDSAGLARFKAAPEDSIRRKLHFGLGRWILVNWGLEDGSRLSHYFRLKGVTIPDDVVQLVIVTWHRKLNDRPLQLDKEIAIIQQRMEAEKKKREEDQKVISVEKRPHKP